ncbi:MAG: hypothetical protein A2992_02360 [Elusimicrobia bacterium RIFCSPLOWO2_01_FULL_59_12]|nr:MAG: hypothetical protein A2992_02360 [Elusimicrobia bacterium RIFCSPLOWO2_01_FULL_59_12]
MATGVSAFQERRWKEAMAAFLEVLGQDPRNAKARTYLNLAAKEIQAQQQTRMQEDRLRVLSQTAQRLEDNRMNAEPIEAALLDSTQAEERAREERWQASCEEADVEMELGHLLPAYDRVSGVLSENSSHRRAQQLLSELQSRAHFMLERGTSLTSGDRFALEGFYAYSGADYAAAVAAWRKGAALLQQTNSTPEAARLLKTLRYQPYWKIAEARVEEIRRAAETLEAFQKGTAFYAQGEFEQALHAFRRIAILNPDYPHLGSYLTQSEAAVEKDRARRLGERKQKEIARLFDAGLAALQQEHYREAEHIFQQALVLDSQHEQARSYLAQVQAELHRRHDPQQAQQHYEAGLVAYAGGRLEDAVREWNMAARMHPDHAKSLHALAKVQKELALNNEIVP